MLEALQVWRLYPGEIESDLSRYHHLDIKEWHQGRMSSRRLLTLIRFLPDESATKTAARLGDWTEGRYLDASVVNELRLMRADLAAIFAGGGDEPDLFRSPYQERVIAEREKARSSLRDKVLAKLTKKGRTD